MSKHKIENKMLKQIDQLDEGVLLGLLKLIMKPAVKRAFKNIEKDMPEIVTTVDGLRYYADELKDEIKKLEKEAKSKDEFTAGFAKDQLKLLKLQ